MAKKILIVDDEEDIRSLLQETLLAAGYEIGKAANGDEVFGMIATESLDLVILDIMMPGLNGFQILRKLRETADVPVIMLSGRRDSVDKVTSFELGADDYITKPFNPEELTARVKAIFRRSQNILVKTNNLKKVSCLTIKGELLIDATAWRVTLAGKNVVLTETEFKLLLELVANEGRAKTYSELLVKVWGTDYKEESNYLHTYIRLLRMNIESDPKNPQHIINIPKVGYRFDCLQK
jgi:DNA-binding response OmpR family regulator